MYDIEKDMELAKYRFSLAEETYRNAQMCFGNGFYRDCINRLYYAVFYAVRAVLALDLDCHIEKKYAGHMKLGERYRHAEYR